VLPALLSTLPLPTFVKFSAVLGITTLFTIVTYHYWVRATMIGHVLNGRRYPRTLPPSGLPPPVQHGHASYKF
jgi:hypothetical protein